ncbi:MAG: hypothetical protein KKH28_12810 [Elusimicrobia bacterium]|nr:hypothetical protein [Elusimicrobiota bacterium]
MGELTNNNNRPAAKADLNAGLEPAKPKLRSGMQAVKSKMQSETQSIKSELKSEIYDIKTETKVYFNKLDNKLDSLKFELREDIKRVALEVEKIHSRVNRIEDRMATKDDVNRILNAIDKFAADAEFYRKKDMLRVNLLTEHEDELKTHENRISLLESKQ